MGFRMAWHGFFLGILLAGTSQAGPELDALLQALEGSAPEEHPALVDAFVEQQRDAGGLPVTDMSGEVVFVYLGGPDTQEVRLVGDFLPESPMNVTWGRGEPMQRTGDVFHARRRFEPGARLDYAFDVDGERIPDPLNPRTLFSGTGDGEVSELVMPGHRLQSAARVWPDVARGTLQEIQEEWADPAVRVYLPADFDPQRRYPVIYTGDGSAWIEYIGLPVILDNLIGSGDIEPVIAVMVDAPGNRGAWHSYNPDFVAYYQRVVAHVDQHFPTLARPEGRVLAGSSSAGRAVLHAALERPDLFSRVAVLSPSMHGPLFPLADYLSGEKQPDPSLEVWMAAGTYEGSIERDTRVLEAWLERAGTRKSVSYSAQGHSFGFWRECAVLLLRHFFPTPPGETQALPASG